MKEWFARENKPGVFSYFGFDAWWNGGSARFQGQYFGAFQVCHELALSGVGAHSEIEAMLKDFANGQPAPW